jgi:hypothetical protein
MRWKEIGVALTTIAGVVVANVNLLHLTNTQNDIITLVCLCILAFNHSVMSPTQEPTFMNKTYNK